MNFVVTAKNSITCHALRHTMLTLLQLLTFRVNKALRSFHTCDFVAMSYCMNYRIIMDCIVITIDWTIAGVNAPTWYNATHNYAKSPRNSSRLKNRRCESSFSRTSCKGSFTPTKSETKVTIFFDVFRFFFDRFRLRFFPRSVWMSPKPWTDDKCVSYWSCLTV